MIRKQQQSKQKSSSRILSGVKMYGAMKKIILLTLFISLLAMGCAKKLQVRKSSSSFYALNYEFKNFFVSPLDCPYKYKPLAQFFHTFTPALKKGKFYNEYHGKKIEMFYFGRLDIQKCLKETINMVKKLYNANGIIQVKLEKVKISEKDKKTTFYGHKIHISGIAIRIAR